MDKCPHCGSSSGVYRNYIGTQFYDFSGAPAGFSDDTTEIQRKFCRCVKCNKKIKISKIGGEIAEGLSD